MIGSDVIITVTPLTKASCTPKLRCAPGQRCQLKRDPRIRTFTNSNSAIVIGRLASAWQSRKFNGCLMFPTCGTPTVGHRRDGMRKTRYRLEIGAQS